MQSQLRLSEAILLGSTMLKPKRGFVISRLTGRDSGCALGMAYKAAGFLTSTTWEVPTHSAIWATLTKIVKVSEHPCHCQILPGDHPMRVQDVITHIFDNHVVLENSKPQMTPWTLEQLVDWVRTQETESAGTQQENHAKLTEEAVTA